MKTRANYNHVSLSSSYKEIFHVHAVEKKKTHFIFNNSPPPENRVVYEKMWKNTVERGRPQMTTWRIRFACWVPKATDTHSQNM